MKIIRRTAAPRRVALLIAAALGAPASAAVTRTWTPPLPVTTASWSDPGNWTPSGIPQNGDSATISVGGSTTQTILYDYSASSLSLVSLIINHNNPIAIVNASEILSISANNLTATFEEIGDAPNRARAEISQSGGQNTANIVNLGVQASNLGAYTLSNNAGLQATVINVGRAGSGLFTNLGGNANVTDIFIASDISGAGTVTISGGTTTAGGTFIGNGGVGVLNISAGTFSSGFASVGNSTAQSSSGIMNLTGGAFVCSGTCTLGTSGAATIDQSGGSFSAQLLDIGSGSSPTALFNLSGGTLTVGGTLTISRASAGILSLTGGSCNVNQLAIGEALGGTCTLSGNAALHATSLLVGDNDFGAFVQTGGFNSSALIVGNLPHSNGSYLLNGPGALLVASNETIGYLGSGTFNQSSGTHIITSHLTLGASTGFGGQGTFHLDGGTLLVGDSETISDQLNGSFFQTGGTHTLLGAANLIIGNSTAFGASGLYSLSGGLLNVPNVAVGGLFGNGLGTFTVTGSGSLTLSSKLSIFTRGTVSLGGTQTLFDLPAVQLNGGFLSIVGPAKTLRTSSLTFAGTTNNWSGHLDTTSNTLLVQSTPATRAATLAFLRNVMILPLAGGGTPNAIFSSSVTADPSTSLALADNADLALTSFRGTSGIDANTFIIAQARFGDANLDQKVDAFDLNLLAAHWQQPTGTLWSAGDFNNDGKVDAFDLNLLAANWQFGTTLEAALAQFPMTNDQFPSSTPSPIPEPNSLAILALSASLLSTRRKGSH